MVADLKYYSHPGKLLEKHIAGIVLILRLCVNCPKIAFLAAIFHDLGKMNPNFQVKIDGKTTTKYAHHSYLSALLFYYFVQKNEKLIRKELAVKNNHDLIIKIKLVIALIISHHQNLENLSDIVNPVELERVWEFIRSQGFPDASAFLSDACEYEHTPFQLPKGAADLSFFNFTSGLSANTWKEEALEYFIEAQHAFSLLVYADKTDAGNYEFENLRSLLTVFKQQLNASLKDIFQQHKKNRKSSELNDTRTRIREDATRNLRKILSTYNPAAKEWSRVFTLTAPTGAGKTFTLLALALEIIAQKGDMGIIYTVPFLSITDQVKEILEQQLQLDILTVNSQAESRSILTSLEGYEKNPTPGNLKLTLQNDFAEQTFQAPFVLTTFVQFFESLISNRNSSLTKLANFSNRIFLIDEFQALPPRLYIFFTAWLEAFCRKYNCYAILSTATMPKLDFPDNEQSHNKDKNPRLLFNMYTSPVELLNTGSYFEKKVFNRYQIKWIRKGGITLDELHEHILQKDQSALVILNTIRDTRSLYNLFKEKSPDVKIILLNTRLMPEDRKRKIASVKKALQNGEKVILISTQLIEAGVDLDFPVVYRDYCPIASLVQSAGRCNRNNLLDFGKVFFFQLINEEGNYSFKYIYGKETANFLSLCDELIYDGMAEKELFDIQQKFYDKINNELIIGNFSVRNKEYNMIELVNNAQFGTLGEFKLIDEDEFGLEYRYYIPESGSDATYQELQELRNELIQANSYQESRMTRIKIDAKLKAINGRIVNIRLNKKSMTAIPQALNQTDIFGLYILSDPDKYSKETGLILDNSNNIL